MRNSVARIAGAGLLALDVVCEEGAYGALTFAGGTCGNVLSILSYLNWTSSAVAYVGDDVAADRVLSDLATVGVSANYVSRIAELRTPVFFQSLRRDEHGRARHSFSRRCPHCGHDPSGQPSAATPIREFDLAEVPDVFFMDRLSEDILSLARSAKKHGALVVYEPSAKSDTPLWSRAFALTDVVKYSADRFASEEIAGWLIGASNPLWEIQTLGEQGLRYRQLAPRKTGSDWTDCSIIRAPRIVDTCGAGDWCTAGLLHGLMMHNKDVSAPQFREAVRLGQAFAAWACAFIGARGAMYSHDRTSAWSSIASLIEGGNVELSNSPLSTAGGPYRDPSRCAPWLCPERL